MFSDFFRELKEQAVDSAKMLRTREFWIYAALVLLLVLMAVAGIRLATGFDPITRGQLRMSFSCQTGQGQLATIIVGGFVFALACVFTLGEVINWLEAGRISRLPGNSHYPVNYWRPLLYVIATVALGVTGYLVLLTWCT